MSATFGKLQGRTLELQNGLNIIQAPNETGKSTWCAFLLSMFYGINSRERDKAGFIADKNRFAPWSGNSMSGRLDCLVNGEEITLTRTTKRQTAPMGNFEAVYSGTGNQVPGLSSICGEELLGVTREVYERSAFIRQSGLAISQDAGLERRIASLITSGEEDTSYSEACDVLKKQLNRRRHNKTGQLPQLENELAEIRRQLEETERLSHQLTAMHRQIEDLETQEKFLVSQLRLHDRWEAAQHLQAAQEAKSAADQAEHRFNLLRQRIEEERIPENETIGRLRGAIVNLETTRKATEKSRAERDEAAKALLRAEAALNESPFVGQTADSARKATAAVPVIRPKLWWVPLLAVPAALGIAYFATQGDFRIGALAAGIAGLISILFMGLRESSDKKKQAAYLNSFGATTQEDLNTLLDTYLTLYEAHETAQSELDKRTAAADTLYNTLSSNEQAILLEIRRFAPAAYDISTADSLLRTCAVRRRELSEAEAVLRETRMRRDLLAQQMPAVPEDSLPTEPPAGSRSAIEAQLQTTASGLAIARSSADRLTGQLHVLGDPAELRSTERQLADQISALETEYQAIRMAMDTLDAANTTLQNRFSPELGRRAAEIFAELTEGKYSGVVLDRSFHLAAEPAGDSIYRDAALLSAGAADQLYLATRLAICELVLPAEKSVPIVLDDALANFDDARCAAALKWLKDAAKQRQIILFTCHSREGNFFANDSEVSVQRLTEAV